MEKLESSKVDDSNDEYEIGDSNDILEGSLGQRLSKFVRGFPKRNVLRLGAVDQIPLGKYYILPQGRKFQAFWFFMVVVAGYSSLFTPVEFGFFRGLPSVLLAPDLVTQAIFLCDIVVRFFTAYKDPETYRLIVDHRSIGLRYLKSEFIPDLLACFPWDTIYKGLGRKEVVRYLVWVRLFRVRKVDQFFEKLEKDIRVNYFAARIVKLLAVEFYCTHTAACIYYYLATSVKASSESYTWIGSLTLGNFSYTDFRAIDLGKRYVTSLYWAILTMATVGYGDIHAVNVREMVFIILFVSFDMILGAYLIGNMTALIVKGSNTEKFRDRMSALIKFMNRNGLQREMRSEIKSHVRLQFESGTMSEGDYALEDLPASIRTKVAYSRYNHIVQQVSIFKGCSPEFLNEIVSKVKEEYFLPGDIVIQQGGAADQFYIVCHGILEEVFVHEDGKEERIHELQGGGVFGEVGVLCGIAQPFTVRVVELCRLLRLDKHSFSDVIQIYFNDGRMVINNLVEVKDTDARVGQLAADITFLVAKQSAELALMVNNASFQGDLGQLKHLVKEGAAVARADYDGRTPLHLAASKGFEGVVLYLIREGADVNAIDKFGISPLLEAVKGGHDICLSVLLEEGAELHLQDAGAFLCQAVKSGNNELLRRLLAAGVNVSASDYDNRTALHLAAAEGSFGLAKMLVDAGADQCAADRWGRTPLDEAVLHHHTPLIRLLQDRAQKPATGAAYRASKEGFLRGIAHHRGLSGDGYAGNPTLCPVSDSLETGLEDVGSFEKGQGYSQFAPSPHSSDSHPGTPRLGHPTVVEGEFSSERHLDYRFSGTRSPAVEGEVSPHQYRFMPVRQVSRRPGPKEQPSFAPVRSRRRVTIFPYHPWTPVKARTAGKVEWTPSNVEQIFILAFRHFGKDGNKLLNQDAGEISSTDLIMDCEKVYVVDENELRARSSFD